jgi:predicted component of type VI protein secretion system
MIVWLRIVAPKAKRGSFKVRLPLLVGRGEEAKFRIQHHQVSRRHCELFAGDGAEVFLRDLGSTNGTFLDGEQIPTSGRTAVRAGGVVRVGKVAFVVEYEQSGVPRVRSDGDDATQPGIAIAAGDGGDDESFAVQPPEEPAVAADGWEAIGGLAADDSPRPFEPLEAAESPVASADELLAEPAPEESAESTEEAGGDEPAADDAAPGEPEKHSDSKLFDFLKGLE